MIIISLVNPPQMLKGFISLFLQEIDTNLFTGDINTKVLNGLIKIISIYINDGSATIACRKMNNLKILKYGKFNSRKINKICDDDFVGFDTTFFINNNR